MKNNPLVSILMTAYNREQYIAEAIACVLEIDYYNWELIIVDDCSSDSTFPIAMSFAEKESRIKLYKNENNLGDYANRNKAAKYASGKYLVYADSDDRMFEHSLTQWVEAMETHQCLFGIFSHTGNTDIFKLDSKSILYEHFFRKPILNFGPVATIVTHAFFKSIKGYPEKYGPANDMYYNLKAASQTSTLVFPFALVDYRIHDGQEFNNKYSYLYNNYLYLRDAIEEIDLPLSSEQKKTLNKKNKRRFLNNILNYYLKTRNGEKTRKAIQLAEFDFRDTITALFQI